MLAHFFRRDLIEADNLAELVLERMPAHASAIKSHLAILGHLGRHADAAIQLGKLASIEPDATVSTLISRPPFRADDLLYYADGLRKAGVPE